YDDRIEISNPGQPIITVDRFIDEYQSRNEKLADVMRRHRVPFGGWCGCVGIPISCVNRTQMDTPLDLLELARGVEPPTG
ncbi:MAG: ATP-binding protein, partial [Pseudomonadota bacterium]|nr:ATP-binding protein [Pseudomonadota bacterium]